MSDDDFASALQRLADRQVAKRRISSAVLAVQSGDNRIDAVVAAGYSDPSGTIPMTPDTPYLLASISKMYTATIIMTLIDAGDIGLDDPISEILPCDLTTEIHVIDGKDYGAKITIGQLLNQTSGLADYFEGKRKGGHSLLDELKQGNDRLLAIEDIASIVRGLPPKFAPGTGKAAYSDTNYALLGAVIVAVTGSPVTANLKRVIYEPLGLTNTFAFDYVREQPEPATIFLKDRPVSIPLFLTSHTTEGGLVSTAADSLRFIRALFTGELLPPERIAFMTRQFRPIFFPLRYGYGVMQFKLPHWMRLLGGPPAFVGHSGSTGSFAFCDTEKDLYVAGTVNQMDNPARPFRLMGKMARLAD